MTALALTVEMTILVLFAAILAGPLIGARLRVPGLLALIFLGMLFGPFGLGWLGRQDLAFDLGAIGILYLMFLAGLGFNIKAFNENRASALGFGLLSFVMPFALSVVLGLTWLEAGIVGAAMLGSMWASNTLVAYQDVRDAGLEQTRAVRDAMSGGVVADVMSLLVLALATTYALAEAIGSASQDEGAVPTLPLYLSIPLLVVFTFWVLPRVGTWFFVRVGHGRLQRLLFVLVGMAAAATIAVVGGIAGIIGAFLAGIGLNRLVPNDSELMEQVDLVGTSIFIPAFLVSIGLRIDPAAMLDLSTILLGVAFLLVVVVGKGLAVLIASLIFGSSGAERGLIGSLSIGQAASTLAVGQIGLELGLFEPRVVNASILTIVLAALLTSFGTQHFMTKVPVPPADSGAIGARVLVDISNPDSDMEALMHLGGRIAVDDDGVEIPYAVARPAAKEVARERVEEADEAASEAGYDTTGMVRLTDSYADGTLELLEETDASLVVMAWQGPLPGSDRAFGRELDKVGRAARVPTVAAHLTAPWDRVVVAPGRSGVPWQAEDVRLTLEIARRLVTRGDEGLLVLADDAERVAEVLGPKVDYEFVQADRPGDAMLPLLSPSDLVVAPAYLLPAMPVHRRRRLASALAEQNLAIVAAPGHFAVLPTRPYGSRGILGQHS